MGWQHDRLSCDMKDNCLEYVTHIDRKGYVYCAKHGAQRAMSQDCRRLGYWELAGLQNGGTTKYDR